MMTKKMKYSIENQTSAHIGYHFPVLDLPVNLIYEVLSRLPLKTIFSCKCVCTTFLKLLEDPYFAEIHLVNASTTTTASLMFQESFGPTRPVSMSMLDLNGTRSTSPRSTDHGHCQGIDHPITKPNLKFCYLTDRMNLVGSCNGLICLYKSAPRRPLYCICNPILGEYTILPHPTPTTPFYSYLQNAGFGLCPKTKQYKVVRLMVSHDPSMAFTSRTIVAEVHTLGTQSWRKIEDAPCPRTGLSFDPFLNGSLHWVTDRQSASDLICSFNLETEKFQQVPPPSHFDLDYLSKISWINVGSLRGCLCLCYIFEGVQFSVWVMKENGFNKCWTNEFCIDFRFFCGLKAEDLYHPIKFMENENEGELCLLCNNVSLLFYSPKKKTFRDLGDFALAKTDVIAHTPSFISLKDAAVVGESLKVKKFKWGKHISTLRF